VATPRPALGHAVDQFHPDLPVAFPRPTPSRGLARGLVLGATATLALTLLPGTAAADPEDVTSAAQLVAQAGHELEVVTEQAPTRPASAAERARADAAQAAAQRTLDDVTARQTRLEADIVDHQAQYDALSAPQQQVVAAHAGRSVAAAPSGAAQIAVDAAGRGDPPDPHAHDRATPRPGAVPGRRSVRP
jgi:hypothetical protein